MKASCDIEIVHADQSRMSSGSEMGLSAGSQSSPASRSRPRDGGGVKAIKESA